MAETFFLPDAEARVQHAKDRQAGHASLPGDLISASGYLFGPTVQSFESMFLPVEDVAHALSQICRFGGHTPRFYSVAEHAVLVSRVLAVLGFDAVVQFAGLHHDDVEALTGDIPRPQKTSEDMAVEHALWGRVLRGVLPDGLIFHAREFERAAYAERFGVGAADNLVLAAEMRAFWGSVLKDVSDKYLAGVRYWCAEPSRSDFLRKFFVDLNVVGDVWSPQLRDDPKRAFLDLHEHLVDELQKGFEKC